MQKMAGLFELELGGRLGVKCVIPFLISLYSFMNNINISFVQFLNLFNVVDHLYH